MRFLRRFGLMLLIDYIAATLSVWLAFWLRFEGHLQYEDQRVILIVSLVYALYATALFVMFGLHNSLWQYSGLNDYLRIFMSVTAGSIPLFLSRAFRIAPVPFGVVGINWLVSLFLIAGIRAFIRLWPELRRRRRGGKNVLIVGAGEAGAIIARELTTRAMQDYNPVGFIDDDPAKIHKRIVGLRVLGDHQKLAQTVKDHAVHEVFIAMPSAPKGVVREIVTLCREIKVPVKILPGIYQLINGQVTIRSLRDVAIEDLLGRPPVAVDLAEVATYLKDETVMVTGAGGSIGAELCRQVARFAPGRLLLLGRGENSIYDIHSELTTLYPDLDIIPVICDVRDRQRLEYVFECHRPAIIFHAAAHKHVPLMEDAPDEAIKNNVFGTRNAAELAHQYHAKSFVLISTDKAVRPTSVMGATKRVAELIIQDLARTSRTRFCAVRFGNVLGSRGSVIPLFRRQISQGGPVTITDARMVRYFMTIPEAVSLLIQAGVMGQSGEIFVLDMGEPVRIVDLARVLIRLYGFEPDKDIQIVETGIRPGEKLYEEILTAEEGINATKHERIFVAKMCAVAGKELDAGLNDLAEALREPAACVEELMALLPRYTADARWRKKEKKNVKYEMVGS